VGKLAISVEEPLSQVPRVVRPEINVSSRASGFPNACPSVRTTKHGSAAKANQFNALVLANNAVGSTTSGLDAATKDLV